MFTDVKVFTSVNINLQMYMPVYRSIVDGGDGWMGWRYICKHCVYICKSMFTDVKVFTSVNTDLHMYTQCLQM